MTPPRHDGVAAFEGIRRHAARRGAAAESATGGEAPLREVDVHHHGGSG
jgi:hypothetical protein